MLLRKRGRQEVQVEPDFVAFDIPDEFVVGYGLDYEGLYRNLKSVWAVLDMPAFTDDPRAFASIAYGDASGAAAAPVTR